MAYVEHIRKRYSRTRQESINSVRVTIKERKYKKEQSRIITIWIGANIANMLNIDKNTRFSFFYDDLNNKKWMLKKSENGYKVTAVNKGNFRLQMTSHMIDTPSLSEVNVTHQVKENYIELYLK